MTHQKYESPFPYFVCNSCAKAVDFIETIDKMDAFLAYFWTK